MRDASYKGVKFDWTEFGRSIQHETQIHRFPNRVDASGKVTATRKPQVDQTSTGPREFNGTAVFTGDDADTRASAFWDVVEAGGPGTFVHPIYGEMQAVVDTGSERREAGDRTYVAIECKFTENGQADIRAQEVPAATVTKKAAAARVTLTDLATLAMAPCLTNVAKAAAAVATVQSCVSDVTSAMRATLSPAAVAPLVAASRALQGSAATLVLSPPDLAADWVAALEGLTPVNLFAAAAAARATLVDRTDEVVAATQDLLRDTAAIVACAATVDDPGDTSKGALTLARTAADELRACATLAATPVVYSALMDLAGATVKALQDASGSLPRTRTIAIPAAVPPLVLAAELYPDDPEAGVLELLTAPTVTGLFVLPGTLEVSGA